jgi:protein-disulfide isomerase
VPTVPTMPRLIHALLVLLVVACAAPAPPDAAPAPAAPPGLTVIPATPLRPSATSARAAVVAPTRPPPLAVSTITPAPSATPTVVIGVDGVRTGSMQRLGIAAEAVAILGEPTAPVTIVEYLDFGCAACRRFHEQVFPSLRREYIDTGIVFYVVRQLPITSRHGVLAAQAAACTTTPDGYWALHAALFREPDAWNADAAAARARIRTAATEAGAVVGEIDRCVADELRFAAVEASTREAAALGVAGTPTFFVNGRALLGSHPIETWRDIIAALQGPGE